VSTLAHYFEEEGVPTAAISLIREHTVKIQPPRALWVPFELGRPLGVPDNPPFQKKVLRALLNLFEEGTGPILADFPEDAPQAGEGPAYLVCPVTFPKPANILNDEELLYETLQQEVAELRMWYDLSIARLGRTMVGTSGLALEVAAKFIGSFLFSDTPTPPLDGIPPLALLRLAIEDLKSFYFEAIIAQPGQQTATSIVLAKWFWSETTAAKILFFLQDRWRESANPTLKDFSRLLLIPRAYQNHSPYGKSSGEKEIGHKISAH
jgi:hypothetical protein